MIALLGIATLVICALLGFLGERALDRFVDALNEALKRIMP